MRFFPSLHRLTPLLLVLLAPAGCGDGATTSGDPTGTGGSAGSSGSGGADCEHLDGTEIAALTAAADEGFAEVAIAATVSEIAIAYTRVNDSRDVTVEFQRLSPEGKLLGSPIPLHTYNLCCGQLASGDFYGRPSMVTNGSRYMVCWEAYKVGCAAVAVGSDKASVASIDPGDNKFAYAPHVTFGPSGWVVFYMLEAAPVAVTLGNDAKPTGTPVAVPATLATGAAGGYAVAKPFGNEVFRLEPDLSAMGSPIQLETAVTSIAAFGDSLSVVGANAETRIGPSNNVTVTKVTDSSSRMAVAASTDMIGVAWSSSDDVVGFRSVDAASHAGPVQAVACADYSVLPAITAAGAGFVIAAPDPRGARDIFYGLASPVLRVVRVE